MARPLKFIGQMLVLVAVMAVIGILSNAPTYHRFPTDEAQLLLSLSHGAKPKGECRVLTPEEVAGTARSTGGTRSTGTAWSAGCGWSGWSGRAPGTGYSFKRSQLQGWMVAGYCCSPACNGRTAGF